MAKTVDDVEEHFVSAASVKESLVSAAAKEMARIITYQLEFLSGLLLLLLLLLWVDPSSKPSVSTVRLLQNSHLRQSFGTALFVAFEQA